MSDKGRIAIYRALTAATTVLWLLQAWRFIHGERNICISLTQRRWLIARQLLFPEPTGKPPWCFGDRLASEGNPVCATASVASVLLSSS